MKRLRVLIPFLFLAALMAGCIFGNDDDDDGGNDSGWQVRPTVQSQTPSLKPEALPRAVWFGEDEVHEVVKERPATVSAVPASISRRFSIRLSTRKPP